MLLIILNDNKITKVYVSHRFFYIQKYFLDAWNVGRNSFFYFKYISLKQINLYSISYILFIYFIWELVLYWPSVTLNYFYNMFSACEYMNTNLFYTCLYIYYFYNVYQDAFLEFRFSAFFQTFEKIRDWFFLNSDCALKFLCIFIDALYLCTKEEKN